MIKIFIYISVLCMCTHICAQDPPVDALIARLEKLASSGELNFDKEDIVRKLDVFERHPLNLNYADANDLKELVILSDRQISNFLNYRQVFGKLLNRYELQAVPGWDLETIHLLLPFIDISTFAGAELSWKNAFKEARQSLLVRTGISMGKNSISEASKQLGSSYRLFLRYRFMLAKTLDFHFLGDKDAGEEFFRGSNRRGFDFSSTHLLWKPEKLLKYLLIGDFSVNLGQGLTQWQGLALGKSTDITSVRRESGVIRTYTSSGEANFCRGIASGFKHKNWTADLFFSSRKLSGNIDIDSLNDEGRITSLNGSGYHRTIAEMSSKNNIRLISAGAAFIYRKPGTKLSLNFIVNDFDRPIRKRPAPYNIFESSGKHFANSSIEFSKGFKSLHVFGEVATDKYLNSSVLGGAMLALSGSLDLSIVARNMSRDYQALFASSFSENQLPANESGVYVGITLRGPPGLTTQFFTDHFIFPWLKYRVSAPSAGHETAALIKYQPSKTTDITCRLRLEEKSGDQKLNAPMAVVVPHLRKSIQLQINTAVSKQVSIKTRFENVWFKNELQPASEGFLIFSDLAIAPTARIWNCNLRLQYFDIDDYDARVYAYENIMSHSFGFPAYADHGWRSYINFHYDLSSWTGLPGSKKTEVWLRLAKTFYLPNSEGTAMQKTPVTDLQFQINQFF